MTDNVLLTIDEQQIATITLNKPAVHNAFDDEIIKQLLTMLQTLNTHPKVKIVVLKAHGKHFSAGADINWMKRTVSYSHMENVKDALALSDLMQTLKFLKQPTIACVQGAAMGGGVGLIACCDLAIASEEASFSLSEVKLGLIPAVISPFVLCAIGERAARYYFLTAEKFSAKIAHHLGLVSQVVEAQNLSTALEELIQQLLENGPEALFAAKQLIARVAANPYLAELREQNALMIAALRASAEGQEGLSAFLEKRKPSWVEPRSS